MSTPDIPPVARELLQRLATLEIEASTQTHAPLHTVEESRRLRGDLPGAHCKNLFLKDKKGALWLIVTLEHRRLDLPRLAKRLGAARLSFGQPERLREALGVEPGSVSPFALVNDPEHSVRVVLDAEMMEMPLLNYHPLVNTATTTLSANDLRRFIASCGHEPMVVNLADLEKSPGG